MKLFFNLFELFAFIYVVKAVTVEYTKDGVLRKDNVCDINFINFGIESSLAEVSVNKSGSTITIYRLKNGNEIIPKKTFREVQNYLTITNDGRKVTDFSVSYSTNSEFTLTIRGINACKNLTVKQTYKDYASVNSFLLYANVVPSPINQSFDKEQFGPSSNNVPYDVLDWDLNKGLDEIREECCIYIDYRYKNGNNLAWYLSTENVNKCKNSDKNCSNEEFYKIVRKNFPNYRNMEELFGNYYEGYVLKRESGLIHMDGIIKSEYIIEVYQEACGNQNGNQVVCTISSDKILDFNEFTKELRNNCLNLIIDKNVEGEWEANSSNVVGKYENYSIKVENNGAGSLPKDKDGEVQYMTFKAVSSSGIARFKTSLVCRDGTYKDDKCRCHACSLGCTNCNAQKCLNCKDNKATINEDKCECESGSYMDKEGKCNKCGEDCATCLDDKTCTTCKDPKKHLVDGKCECKDPLKHLVNGECKCGEGYYEDSSSGNCVACKPGCKKCNESGCLECEGKGKVPKDGVCVCDNSYYENPKTHTCEKCDISCATCNDKGRCTTCLDREAKISDGVCVCKHSYLTNTGKCYVCDKGCKTCDENGCTSCADASKKPENGKCI